MWKYLRRYFAVIIPLNAVIVLVIMALCDMLWYGGFIGYSDTICNIIAVVSSTVLGLLVDITGIMVADGKWTLRIGAK